MTNDQKSTNFWWSAPFPNAKKTEGSKVKGRLVHCTSFRYIYSEYTFVICRASCSYIENLLLCLRLADLAQFNALYQVRYYCGASVPFSGVYQPSRTKFSGCYACLSRLIAHWRRNDSQPVWKFEAPLANPYIPSLWWSERLSSWRFSVSKVTRATDSLRECKYQRRELWWARQIQGPHYLSPLVYTDSPRSACAAVVPIRGHAPFTTRIVYV